MEFLRKIGIFRRFAKDARIPSKKEIKNFFDLFEGYTPAWTNAPEALYEMELIRSAIGSFALFVSKLSPEVRGQALAHMDLQWQIAINPFMETSKFLYRVATILSVENNVFIIPVHDASGRLVGFYPLLPRNCEIVDYEGVRYLRYTFSDGKRAAIEFERVGILNNFQYGSDFFGESNHALKTTMQLIHTNNQGIINGVKSSANIRFIGKIANMISPEDIKKERDRFSAENLSEDNKSGMMIYDNKFTDVEQVKSQPFTVNAPQMKQITENVYRYFGTNEKILQNDYDEDGFNAYYQGKIEPFAIQLSLVLTRMTYTERQIAHGNRIIFSLSRLEYASNRIKAQLSTTFFDRGLLNRADILTKLWGLPAPKDGDAETYFIRKEYIRLEDLGKELDYNAKNAGQGIQGNDEPVNDADTGAHKEI
ncbi:MAG: phage portal protein [Defluviitaleaceae bacterium]|nr:phage portal protein [Defluviitaleaceae bacterium]